MAITRSAFSQAAEVILEGGAKRVSKYFSSTQVMKATRRGRRTRRDRTIEILFTIGAPNYAERQFIKRRLRDGGKFPMKGLVIKW